MPDTKLSPEIRRAIEGAALRLLPTEQRRKSSLFIDDRVLERGQVLGLKRHGIRVKSLRAVLVFVDPEPQTDFGHPCRYMLFNPDSGALVEDYAAEFPPYPEGWPVSFERFDERSRSPGRHEMRRGPQEGTVHPPGGQGLVQAVQGAGRRFAILFAGVPYPCHLNTMEFAYRVLLEHGFPKENIIVACYKGGPAPNCPKWQNAGGVHQWPSLWPGTGPANLHNFQMPVHKKGNPTEFRKALELINQQMPGPNDLVFIYTTGHGSGVLSSGPQGVYLLTLSKDYGTAEFQADLGILKDTRGATRLGKLVVLMAQCCSGGFENAVLNSGAATDIAFSSAAQWNSMSHHDGDNDQESTWSCFPRDWLAAQVKAYDDLTPLTHNPIALQLATANAPASVRQAFDYSSATPPKHPLDQPVGNFTSAGAEQVVLDGT